MVFINPRSSTRLITFGKPPALLSPFLVLAGLLAGCAAGPGGGEDSPWHRYPADTRLVLNRTLEIPPDSATVRLQFGRTVARNGVQEVEPHCILELDTVSDRAQRVEPDSFRVTRVSRSERSFSGMPVVGAIGGFPGRNAPSHIYYSTEFRLHSDRQAGVRRLTCQSNQQSAGIGIMRHLTPTEIRQTLGAIFSLLPP